MTEQITINSYLEKRREGKEVTFEEKQAFLDSMRSDKIADAAIAYSLELKGRIGSADYKMKDGSWTDRYETLNFVRQDELIKSKYTIYESDKIKGTRISIVDSLTKTIIGEI